MLLAMRLASSMVSTLQHRLLSPAHRRKQDTAHYHLAPYSRLEFAPPSMVRGSVSLIRRLAQAFAYFLLDCFVLDCLPQEGQTDAFSVSRHSITLGGNVQRQSS